MEHHHLLDLEREARRAGSGLNVSDLLGHWQLQTVWPKGRTEANALSGWLLRSLGACLEISADSDGVLQLRTTFLNVPWKRTQNTNLAFEICTDNLHNLDHVTD